MLLVGTRKAAAVGRDRVSSPLNVAGNVSNFVKMQENAPIYNGCSPGMTASPVILYD